MPKVFKVEKKKQKLLSILDNLDKPKLNVFTHAPSLTYKLNTWGCAISFNCSVFSKHNGQDQTKT